MFLQTRPLELKQRNHRGMHLAVKPRKKTEFEKIYSKNGCSLKILVQRNHNLLKQIQTALQTCPLEI